MNTLMLELTPDLYSRLRQEAERIGKPLEKTAQELLAQRLESATPGEKSDRDRVREELQAASLLKVL